MLHEVNKDDVISRASEATAVAKMLVAEIAYLLRKLRAAFLHLHYSFSINFQVFSEHFVEQKVPSKIDETLKLG